MIYCMIPTSVSLIRLYAARLSSQKVTTLNLLLGSFSFKASMNLCPTMLSSTSNITTTAISSSTDSTTASAKQEPNRKKNRDDVCSAKCDNEYIACDTMDRWRNKTGQCKHQVQVQTAA